MPSVSHFLIRAGAILMALTVSIAAPPASAQQSEGERRIAPKRNPDSKKVYEVMFRFADLPGPLAEIRAFAQYEVGNLDCVPVDYSRTIGGVRLPPEYRIDLPLERRDDAFVIRFHEDALADTDMFGLGACRWRMDGVTVNFKSATTLFVGGISTVNLHSATPDVQHYLAKDFLEKPQVGDWLFGEKPDHFLKSLGPQFTLTATPRRLP